jgi:predicted RNase H-like HicB family nuclease
MHCDYRREPALGARLLDSTRARRRDPMYLTVEIDREADGRWLAEVPDLPGVLAYGATRDEAVARVEALALRVLADRLEHGEAGPDLVSVSFRAA